MKRADEEDGRIVSFLFVILRGAAGQSVMAAAD